MANARRNAKALTAHYGAQENIPGVAEKASRSLAVSPPPVANLAVAPPHAAGRLRAISIFTISKNVPSLRARSFVVKGDIWGTMTISSNKAATPVPAPVTPSAFDRQHHAVADRGERHVDA
jgi:hypothetical protein